MTLLGLQTQPLCSCHCRSRSPHYLLGMHSREYHCPLVIEDEDYQMELFSGAGAASVASGRKVTANTSTFPYLGKWMLAIERRWCFPVFSTSRNSSAILDVVYFNSHHISYQICASLSYRAGATRFLAITTVVCWSLIGLNKGSLLILSTCPTSNHPVTTFSSH